MSRYGTVRVARVLSRQHALVTLAVFATFIAPVLLLGIFSNPNHTATALVRVDPNDDTIRSDPFQVTNVPDAERFVLDQIEIIESRSVIDGAADELAVPPATVARAVDAVRTDLNNVIEIRGESSDARLAARYAEAVARAYLDNRATRVQDQLAAALARIDDQLAAIGDEQGERSAEVAALQERRADVVTLMATRTLGTELVASPGTPDDSEPAVSRRVLALAVVAAAFTAVGIATVREQLNPHAWSGRAAAQAAEVPWFNVVGASGAVGGAGSEAALVDVHAALVTVNRADEPTAVVFVGVGAAVTGAVVQKIAAACALSGVSTVLVKPDLGSSEPDRRDDALALVNVRPSAAASVEALNMASIPVRGTGHADGMSAPMVSRQEIGFALAELKVANDWVIVDATRIREVHVAMLLGQEADGVVMCAPEVGASKAELERFARALRDGGCNILGMISVIGA